MLQRIKLFIERYRYMYALIYRYKIEIDIKRLLPNTLAIDSAIVTYIARDGYWPILKQFLALIN